MGEVVVGVDVGGSKAAVVAIAADGSRTEAVVPSAAWHRAGDAGVSDGIAGTARALLGDAVPAAVAVGAHGCDTADQQERLRALLEVRLGAATLVVNDAELLLPAAGRRAGVGLVSGTGSIAVGYDSDSDPVAVGGWGGYLGDLGSATGMFLDAGRALADARDRDDPEDPMEPILLELCELRELRDLPAALGDAGSPTTWAHLTPALFDRALAAGSSLARRVVRASGDALARLVMLLAQRGCATDAVVAGGGLIAHATWLQDALRASLADGLPDAELIVLIAPPVDGAAWLAAELARAGAADLDADALHPALARRHRPPRPLSETRP